MSVTPMSGRSIQLAALVVVVLAIVAAAWILLFTDALPKRRVHVSDVEQEVTRGLPVGSSQTEIRTFLTKKGWQPSGPSEVNHLESLGILPGTQAMTGVVRDSYHDLFGTDNIWIYFALDDRGTLAKIVVLELGES